MLGAIVYFSGTGNTEFVAKEFLDGFAKQGVECDLVDICKEDEFEDKYDFYVFGAPIHAETFPEIFYEWIDKNIKAKGNRKCIVFSTQAAENAAGADILSEMLELKSFNFVLQDYFQMPNNYYVVAFKKNTSLEVNRLLDGAKEKVAFIIRIFDSGENYCKKVSIFRKSCGKIANKFFSKTVKNWAKKKLVVDKERCINCKLCETQCPTKNIKVDNKEVSFQDKCISCQKCLHKCPVNAFKYKGKEIEQYKLN